MSSPTTEPTPITTTQEDAFGALLQNIFGKGLNLNFCDPYSKNRNTADKDAIVLPLEGFEGQEEDTLGTTSSTAESNGNSSQVSASVPRSIAVTDLPSEEPEELQDAGVEDKQDSFQIISPDADAQLKSATKPGMSLKKVGLVLLFLLGLLVAISSGFTNIQVHKQQTIQAQLEVIKATPEVVNGDVLQNGRLRRGQRIGRLFKPIRERIVKFGRRLRKKKNNESN